MKRCFAIAAFAFAFASIPIGPANAQELEGTQAIVVGIGVGALGNDDAPDAQSSTLLLLGFEARQRPWLFAFGRLEADNAPVRQHLSVNGGLRAFARRDERLRPYGGVGAGLLWLEPKTGYGDLLQRGFAPRGDAFVGADFLPRPALRLYAEYRLTGARYGTLRARAACTPVGAIDSCLEEDPQPELQLGHAVWVGIRVKMY